MNQTGIQAQSLSERTNQGHNEEVLSRHNTQTQKKTQRRRGREVRI